MKKRACIREREKTLSMENENVLQNIDEQGLGEEAEAILSQMTGGWAGPVYSTTVLGAGGGSILGGVLGHDKSVGSGGGAGIGAGIGAVAGVALGGAGVAAKKIYDNGPRALEPALELERH